MFSDTHFHLGHTMEKGQNMVSVFETLAKRDTFFALDIGTHCDDLKSRVSTAFNQLNQITDATVFNKAKKFLFFSAGIWPAQEACKDRFIQIKELENQVLSFLQQGACDFEGNKLVAIGECGIDHHWNPSGADNRCIEDFATKEMLNGESQLFEMQIELAKKLSLPVIVHSRDGFEATYDCIKNIGYDCGIIHCYSYGVKEAKAFLDRGWNISFSGSITYAKPSKMPLTEELIKYVPLDRMLIETDSPYLAPVPHRGKVNSSVYVEFVYNFVANILNISPENLSLIVDQNIRNLFIL